jgi:hypothetical protein
VLNVDVYFAHVYDTIMIANKQTKPPVDTLNAFANNAENNNAMEMLLKHRLGNLMMLAQKNLHQLRLQ